MQFFETMAGWQLALLGTYAAVVLIAYSRHIICSREIKKITFLKPDSPQLTGGEVPLVSVLVPAKDESERIEGCIQSLLEQDYANFEVIVVDDRSEDNTAEIVERMAAQDDRLRLVRIEELPPGWTGKTHALHVGQKQARGEWLLFVDADTNHHRSCLSVVLRDCIDHGADMESLLPALKANSFWESVIQPYAGTCLIILFPLSRVNNPNCMSSGFANGQFILVHRDAYERIGGHFGVRDKFVEDIHLGRAIRERGLGLRVVVGSALMSVRMYSSLREIVRGWSRILYAAVDFRPQKLHVLFAFICLLSVLPYAVIFGNGIALAAGMNTLFVKLGLALGLLHEFGQLTLYARTYATSRSPLRFLAFRWLAVLVMLRILRRTIRMCHTHEVTWRGTTYGPELQHVSMAMPQEATPSVERIAG